MATTPAQIPVMKPMLPIASEVLPLLQEMDDRQWYSNRGPLVNALEERIAAHLEVSAERVVVCSSATLALQAACALAPVLGFNVPAYTFPATVLAALNAGAKVSLLDICGSNWQIDANRLPEQRGWGLIRVLPFGAPATLDPFREWEHVVIDAAASLGSDQRSLADLPEAWWVVFSMHATKVLGMGEGGVLVTGSVRQAAQTRAWINFGFSGTRNSQSVGTNAKVSEIAAAYGIAAFNQWHRERTEWRTANRLARDADQSLGTTSIVSDYSGATPYWIAQFVDVQTTNRVEAELRKRGIGTRRWWERGCHQMDAFSDISQGRFPVTEDVASRTLGLPMFRGMSAEEVDEIAEAVSTAM